MQNCGRRKTSLMSQHADALHRVRQAVEKGQYSKAIQLLSSNGLVQTSENVKSEMLGKHPQAAPSKLPLSSTPRPVKVEELVVLKAVRSFAACTTPGP